MDTFSNFLWSVEKIRRTVITNKEFHYFRSGDFKKIPARLNVGCFLSHNIYYQG
jgi:hypothetical protein